MAQGWTAFLVEGDITRYPGSAIVNAANSALAGGGGVDGAIHRAAGPELSEACRRIGGCPTGEARVTPGFRLPARYVIHAVGPIWRGGGHDEARLLASAYRSSLDQAEALAVPDVAFPALSIGAYGYPAGEATRIALSTVFGYPRRHLELVTFVVFSPTVRRIYRETARELGWPLKEVSDFDEIPLPSQPR
ncbi:MAG: O-acetyl-ADP-ribose deacetylase [Firmicutes bacterium]|nr:O-acetyl-ADP-ribose deacetylase [Alicyclobacillaceae bacterium]MCL6497067.1 O-acetyl-ADP-ribose deacetylase [Bacillota bacterium]